MGHCPSQDWDRYCKEQDDGIKEFIYNLNLDIQKVDPSWEHSRLLDADFSFVYITNCYGHEVEVVQAYYSDGATDRPTLVQRILTAYSQPSDIGKEEENS